MKNDNKTRKKWTLWKVIGALCILPLVIMYYIFKYIYKFYKSEKFTKKQKIIITCVIFALISIYGIISEATKGPEIDKVTVENIELYKDKSKKIEFKVSPKDAKIKETSFKNYDHAIISVEDNKITGLEEGETEVICKIIDEHSNKIKTNKFKVTVKLTDEQIAEKNAKLAEEAKKDEEELQEKRNTISTTEAITIKSYCKDIIDGILKAPSTAEYPGGWLDQLEGWNMSKNNNLVTVSSYVDAENSFGAKIRSEFIVQIQMQDNGEGQATYVQFDGEVIMGSYQ